MCPQIVHSPCSSGSSPGGCASLEWCCMHSSLASTRVPTNNRYPRHIAIRASFPQTHLRQDTDSKRHIPPQRISPPTPRQLDTPHRDLLSHLPHDRHEKPYNIHAAHEATGSHRHTIERRTRSVHRAQEERREHELDADDDGGKRDERRTRERHGTKPVEDPIDDQPTSIHTTSSERNDASSGPRSSVAY